MTKCTDRERLQTEFESLLDARDELIALPPSQSEGEIQPQEAQFYFIKHLAEFCAELLGENRHFKQGKRTDIQQILFTIRAWWPALRDDDSSNGLWSNFLDELHRLEYGDVPVLLSPAERRRGQSPQAARIHQTRLYALQIDAFLKQHELPPNSYRKNIENAFGADWDRIRKWKQLAEIGLGEDVVRFWMDAARSGELDWLSIEELEKSIFRAASEYREAAGLAPILNHQENKST